MTTDNKITLIIEKIKEINDENRFYYDFYINCIN